MDSENKEVRRQKLADKFYKKPQVSEEQRFVSKSKKQHKRKMQDIKAEEIWEDWENEIP